MEEIKTGEIVGEVKFYSYDNDFSTLYECIKMAHSNGATHYHILLNAWNELAIDDYVTLRFVRKFTPEEIRKNEIDILEKRLSKLKAGK